MVGNLYPLIIIGENMWKLEGFHYAIALYIKTGYYTISVLTKSQDMMTIMTEFGKFRYNHLLTGMWTSGDTFQAKVDEVTWWYRGN